MVFMQKTQMLYTYCLSFGQVGFDFIAENA